MSSKGVSPVVATVLLMGIAIASVSSAAVFLGGTMDSLQIGVEDWIAGEDKEESSEFSIDYAYNGTDGFLRVDLRNTGSRSLVIEEEGEKNINMYIDDVPEQWEYIDGSDYVGQQKVILNPTSDLTINTTRSFPADGDTVELEFNGPYGTEAGYICFSQNGGCQR